MKNLSLLLCALFLSSAALAQGTPPQNGPTLLPDPGQMPVVPPGTPGHDAPLQSGQERDLEVGLDPEFLEIAEGELLALPRPYGQTPCAEAAVRRIFRDQAADDFLATLRCWRIPQARSSDFVQVLDQAVEAAGWQHTGGAGMQTHYVKGEKNLDVLIFGFDQFGDPEDDTNDVGYLFGVYEEDE